MSEQIPTQLPSENLSDQKKARWRKFRYGAMAGALLTASAGLLVDSYEAHVTQVNARSSCAREYDTTIIDFELDGTKALANVLGNNGAVAQQRDLLSAKQQLDGFTDGHTRPGKLDVLIAFDPHDAAQQDAASDFKTYGATELAQQLNLNLNTSELSVKIDRESRAEIYADIAFIPDC